MDILVFGQTGQVARELAPLEGVRCLSRSAADLSDPAACAAQIAQANVSAVINAAAYTGVDRAETEPELARTINAAAPGAMAQACAARGLPFVQISTDYVFDGAGTTPWREEDPVGPLGVYGATKLAGERAVRAAGGVHAILRTSWVVSAHGTNFVNTMLRLGSERDQLSIVADQIGAPTPARAIAQACWHIAHHLADDPAKGGTYHFAGAPETSWADFARTIFEQAALPCQVTDIPAADYPTPAARPANSRLDCSKIASVFGISRPDWRVGLSEILQERQAHTS